MCARIVWCLTAMFSAVLTTSAHDPSVTDGIGGKMAAKRAPSAEDASSAVGGDQVRADDPHEATPIEGSRPPEAGPDEGVTMANELVLSRPAKSTAGFQWVGPEVDYKLEPVLCPKPAGANIGRMDFKFRAYRDTGKTYADVGGAALEGGFTHNGADPCSPNVQKFRTTYDWVQTVLTSHPKPGRGPGDYVDSRTLPGNPFYPHSSNNNNPAGNPFTESFYDGPWRYERAAEDIAWLGELMFVCKNTRKIEVIGSFFWGFSISADGSPNDGNVAVTGIPPHPFPWSAPTQQAINALAREARGTRYQLGWTVLGEGCCCQTFGLPECSSAADGLCSVLVDNPQVGVVTDQLIFFPRNRAIDPQTFEMATPPGWVAMYWEFGKMAPPLPYQDVTEAFEMFEAGLLYVNVDQQPGPDVYWFDFLLTGHESFFDVYVHMLPEDVWLAYVIPTQQLLGDMDGNEVIDEDDLPVWTLAFEDPDTYIAMYGLDPLFAGDLNHNDVLDRQDSVLLKEIITAEQETDATDMALECQSHDDCNDFDPCTHDQCADDEQCTNTPAPYDYGDVDHNGAKNVFDVFCILDLIAGDPPASPNCTLPNADLHPCEANGVINVFDALAILEAIAGTDPCCGEGRAALRRIRSSVSCR